MSTSITYPGGNFAPLDALGYEASRESRNIVHELLSGSLAVSHRPAALRTGSLALLFDNEIDAAACLNGHAVGGRVFTLSVLGRPSASMSYVTAGRLSIELASEVEAWTVLIDYQEVTP